MHFSSTKKDVQEHSAFAIGVIQEIMRIRRLHC